MILRTFCIIFVALCAANTLAAPSTLNQADKSKPAPKDFFEDEIRIILQMSVKELLEYTMDTFSRLNILSLNCYAEVDKLLNQASSEVREDLEKIRDDTESILVGNVSVVIGDLAKVLPSLSDWSKDKEVFVEGDMAQFSAGDIIWALLQITLQSFIKLISNTLEASDIILVRIMIEFERLAADAKPEVGNALIKISDEFLQPARMVILPVLHDLQKVLGSKRKSKEVFKPGNINIRFVYPKFKL